MMLYKQGRFWVEGASFQIPEGFYIETDPDVNYERGLAAWDPTRTHLSLWAISEEEEEGTKARGVLQWQKAPLACPVSHS